MEFMSLDKIRETYLEFFEKKGHLPLKSYSLIPENDKSLLLINSGMAPLKTFFTGQEIPPKKKITTCQKCIRTGDIENVGKTSRHGTFFEMLGNFSFGDYFKKEAIKYSYEFCTEVLKIPLEKIYVSVYYKDEESYEIWNKEIKIKKEHIVKLKKEDNFWEVGVGPCGPCSEIYYDRGEEYGCRLKTCNVGCNCDRYIEFWNIVFTQYYKEKDGSYSEIKSKNIDTGMGLERMALIMQNANTLFDIDKIKNIRNTVSKKVLCKYNENNKKDISIRIITDHIRSLTFMAGDGVIPSNEARGYVLRRLIRRAIRHGKLLGVNKPFLSDLCNSVIDEYKNYYQELEDKREYILKIVSKEENNFYETLDQGMEKIKEIINKAKINNNKVISGLEAFKMYDTYGFPLDLLKEILEEENLQVEENIFYKEMDIQKNRSRSKREVYSYMGVKENIYEKLDVKENTKFLGYENYYLHDSIIKAIILDNNYKNIAKENDKVIIILDKTNLYAESGGQIGDRGIIKTKSGQVKVNNCIKVNGEKFAHIGVVIKGEINLNDFAEVIVDKDIRNSITRNHTATHLLHKALKDILGKHIEQAGSYISDEKLRFDFTHFTNMTEEEIAKVEKIVNDKILENLKVEILEKDIKEAKSMGAVALFGEKYKDIVRVINIDNYSIELCGGTHVKNTSFIGSFKIISESSVSSGVRRIEAITGENVLNYYKKQEKLLNEINLLLKSDNNNVIKKLEEFIKENNLMKAEISKISNEFLKNKSIDIINKKILIKDINVIISKVENIDINGLRNITDNIKNKIEKGIIVLFSTKNNKANIIVKVDKEILNKKEKLSANNIIKEIAKIIEAKGGGKQDIAQAGGGNILKIDEAIKKAKEIIYNII